MGHFWKLWAFFVTDREGIIAGEEQFEVIKGVTFSGGSGFSPHSHRSCNDCRRDLSCGYCYVDGVDFLTNASCLSTNVESPWTATTGRCQGNVSSIAAKGVTWAYDYCPTPYSWMPMVGLVLYLISFAPGKKHSVLLVCCDL